MIDLLDELSALRGEYKPSYHKCIIAVSQLSGSYLIHSEPDIQEGFDGCMLEDNITDESGIPKEAGIYRCIIKYHCFKCNIPIDPVEYDVRVTIESYEKIELSYK